MIYGVFGLRERGKTTLTAHLSGKLPQRVILDPRAQFPTHRRITTALETREAIDRMAVDPDASPEVVITPRRDLQSVFEVMSQTIELFVTDFPERKLAIVIDEMRFVKVEASDAFQWILRCTPRDHVHVFFTAHRPIQIPPDTRAILDHWILFQTTHQRDLDLIADQCGDRAARLVRGLKPYEWIHWNDGIGQLEEHRDPARYFVPLTHSRKHAPVAVLDAGAPSSVEPGRLFER